MAEPTSYVCENGHKHSAADLPPGALRCEIDKSPLRPAGEPPPARPVPSNGATGSLRVTRALRIVFEGTVLTVARGEQVMLGRDPEYSPHAPFFDAFDNVSRRHAIVGLDPDGRAWIRDYYSTNLTKVNSEPVSTGQECDLRDRDKIRLCANLIGTVELVREAPDAV